MKINSKILCYLKENNWEVAYVSNTVAHYIKVKDSYPHHLFIIFYEDKGDYEVRLGVNTKKRCEIFKLRKIISVLKGEVCNKGGSSYE